MYNGQAASFHPKAYFFNCGDIRQSYVFVGSSNISKPALTNGVEWNYKVYRASDSSAYETFQDLFEKLYKYESYILTETHIRDYRDTLTVPDSERKNNRINVHFNKYKQEQEKKYVDKTIQLYEPRAAQPEALFELQKTREQGNDKGLVVAATGIGKTYLAGFDSKQFDSVLFVAHREEILNQAADTFAKLRGSDEIGFLNQSSKSYDKKILFASVQTLCKQQQLDRFERNQFEYMVIDEFHHASSPSYRKIVDYFNPKFMLGLTATPHRLDKKDVFQLCDYNVPYEISLFSAINRDWLVPFRYYGIYDSTVKYENVTFLNGKYVDKELSKALSIEKRAELIYRHYMKHQRSHTLGFCSSIDHAEYMAGYFKEQGINAVAVHSATEREHVAERHGALDKFRTGEIEVVFAVDMLNEGVDVPNINLIMFLRPTESPTVFLQQLGRGLRHAEDKADLKVLDFIGNYRNVELLPFWLSGKVADKAGDKRAIIKDLVDQRDIPLGCFVDFDLEVVDIFERMIKSKVRISERIDELYDLCKSEVERVPLRMDFFESLNDIDFKNIKKSGKQNPFKDFLAFIDTKEEGYVPDGFFGSEAHLFIRMIEETKMSALYKIPILLAFYNDGDLRTKICRKEVQASFYKFYQNRRHWKDLDRHLTRNDFRTWKPEGFWELAQENPIHFLSKTHSDVFEYDKKNQEMRIKLDFAAWLNHEFFIEQIKDSIDFRRNQFLDVNLGKQ